MTSRRSTRRHLGGARTGLIAALAAIGLVSALVAVALTTSFLDPISSGRVPVEAATRADLDAPRPGPAGDGASAAARPVLRVTDGTPLAGPDPDAADTDPDGSNGVSTTATTPAGTRSSPTANTESASTSADTGMDANTGTERASGSKLATTTGPTPGPIQPADPDARFVTLPPGAALPSGADCAARVRPTPENVPENRTRNLTRGGPVGGTYLSSNPSIGANDYEARIDGDFVGSTDEIIQWAACKWGFDEDLLRAQVYAESTWYAGKLGDCGEATVPETGGCASVGLIQVRSAELGATHHPGVYPQAWRSSALNLDYGLAVQRLCFEGLESWLGQTGDYGAGDQWKCMGRWFSGSWGDAGSADYQAKIRDILARRPWETWVGCRDWQTNNHCGG